MADFVKDILSLKATNGIDTNLSYMMAGKTTEIVLEGLDTSTFNEKDAQLVLKLGSATASLSTIGNTLIKTFTSLEVTEGKATLPLLVEDTQAIAGNFNYALSIEFDLGDGDKRNVYKGNLFIQENLHNSSLPGPQVPSYFNKAGWLSGVNTDGNGLSFFESLSGVGFSSTNKPIDSNYFLNEKVGIGGTGPAKFGVYGLEDEIQTIIRGFTSQTQNLQEWQNSSGSFLSSVSKDGAIRTNKLSSNAGFYLGNSDSNNGLRYAGTGLEFASSSPDGPVLHGLNGGILGTLFGGQKIALKWNADGQIDLPNGPIRVLSQYLKRSDNAYTMALSQSGVSPDQDFHIFPDHIKQSGAIAVNLYFGFNSEIKKYLFNSKWSGANTTLFSIDASTSKLTFNAVDTEWLDNRNLVFGINTGTRIGTASNQKIGFYGKTPVIQQTGGPATAGITYSSNEQTMLQKVYDALRNIGITA